MADAPASGAGVRKGVGVQVPPRALLSGLQPVKMLQPSKMLQTTLQQALISSMNSMNLMSLMASRIVLQITVRPRLRFAVASARSMQCQQRIL